MIRGKSAVEGLETLPPAGKQRLHDAVQLSIARGWDVSGEVDGNHRTIHIRSEDVNATPGAARQIVILGTFEDCMISFWMGGVQKQRRSGSIRDVLTLWFYVGILGFRDLAVDGDRVLENTIPGPCEMSFEWKSKPSSEETNDYLIRRWKGLLEILKGK